MEKTLRILILEDVPADAKLMERELRKEGMRFSSKRVETKEAFQKELMDFDPDLILGDYRLPSFDGLSALEIAREKRPKVPFIFISGSIGEELAIEALKKGATDHVFKERLSRLVPAVNRALREVEERSDREHLQIQLSQAQKLESIGQLAAGIAHEINTPIQYVGDNTRFLQGCQKEIFSLIEKYRHFLRSAKEGEVSQAVISELEKAESDVDFEYLFQEVPKAIQQSLEGVDRVAKIVRAMKEFSHPGIKEKTAVDINKAIETTITIARNEWKYVSEMMTDLDPSLPLVLCLPDDFNQVILNIIVNAAHAIARVVGDGSKGKGTITVKTKSEDNWVEVRISDTGTGIPEEIRGRIFDPFFTTKEVGKGTGQGLTISHSIIVKKHGGTLTFETEEGKGTTFIIRLPVEPKTD